MPTIPVLIYTEGQSSAPGATGWRLSANKNVPYVACQPTIDGYMAWREGEGDAVGSLSLSTSGVPREWDGSGIFFYPEVLYLTYPDGDMVDFQGYYYSDSTTSHVRIVRPVTALGLGVILDYKNLNATVDNPFSPDAIVTLSIKYPSCTTDKDGTVIYQHFDRAQARAGGVVYDFSLTPTGAGEATITSTYGTTASEHLGFFTTHFYEVGGSVEIPLSAIPLEIRLGNPHGEWLQWNTIKFKPAGTFAAAMEDDELTLDARGVYFVGSEVKSGDGFQWSYNSDYSSNFFYNTDLALDVKDTSAEALHLDVDGNLNVRLTAVSALGCSSDLGQIVIVQADGGVLPLLYDKRTGTTRILYKENANMRALRDDAIKPPQLDSSQPLVASGQTPVSIMRYGSEVLALAKTSEIYRSMDDGQSWTEVNRLVSGAQILAACISHDGAVIHSLAKTDSDGSIASIVSHRTSAGFSSLFQDGVTGLSGLASPCVLLTLGTLLVAVCKKGGDVVLVCSRDSLTWNQQTIASGAKLLGAMKSGDSSRVMVLIKSGEQYQLVSAHQSGGESFTIEAAQDVTVDSGASDAKSPSALDCDGARCYWVYKAGSGYNLSTSMDMGMAWETA